MASATLEHYEVDNYSQHSFAQIISDCIDELHTIAMFQGSVKNSRVELLLTKSSDAYLEAQKVGGSDFDDAVQAYKKLWAASLQASYAVTTRSITELEDTNCDNSHHFNQLLSECVSANSKLCSGQHVIQYNYEQVRSRIAHQIQCMKAKVPNHRFPADVAIDHILQEH